MNPLIILALIALTPSAVDLTVGDQILPDNALHFLESIGEDIHVTIGITSDGELLEEYIFEVDTLLEENVLEENALDDSKVVGVEAAYVRMEKIQERMRERIRLGKDNKGIENAVMVLERNQGKLTEIHNRVRSQNITVGYDIGGSALGIVDEARSKGFGGNGNG